MDVSSETTIPGFDLTVLRACVLCFVCIVFYVCVCFGGSSRVDLLERCIRRVALLPLSVFHRTYTYTHSFLRSGYEMESFLAQAQSST